MNLLLGGAVGFIVYLLANFSWPVNLQGGMRLPVALLMLLVGFLASALVTAHLDALDHPFPRHVRKICADAGGAGAAALFAILTIVLLLVGAARSDPPWPVMAAGVFLTAIFWGYGRLAVLTPAQVDYLPDLPFRSSVAQLSRPDKSPKSPGSSNTTGGRELVWTYNPWEAVFNSRSRARFSVSLPREERDSTAGGDIGRLVSPSPAIVAVAEQLRQQSKANGFSTLDEIGFVCALVQQTVRVPEPEAGTTGDEVSNSGLEVPARALYTGRGDMRVQVVTAASLLSALGYQPLVLIGPRGWALGLRGADALPGNYFIWQGSKYYFVQPVDAGNWHVGGMTEESAAVDWRVVESDLPASLTAKQNSPRSH